MADEQIEILRAIWNEMKALNSRVDKTNAGLESTNQRLDAVRTELTAEISAVRTELKAEMSAVRTELKTEIAELRVRTVESELRLSTVTTQLAGDIQTLSSVIRDWRDEHRADRAEMKQRITRLERHVGLESR